MRLIDADALHRKVLGMTDADFIDFADMLKLIDSAPTIDPVKHGEWIKNEGRHGWHCSVCGEDDLYAFAWNSDTGGNELQDNYCPNCGAKIMRGENED